MFINKEKCVMCGQCVPYCPIGCIFEGDGVMEIDYDECVECGVCKRNAGCPMDAFEQPPLDMPRYVRKAFSDPFGKHENTKQKHTGRGTEEIKTNDVTGIIHDLDTVGIAIEMGRPGVGVRFSQVQVISSTLASFGVVFEENNPVTLYMTDRSTGEFDPTILNEKVLSCIVECTAPASKLLSILDAVKLAGSTLPTVFSVCVLCKIDENDNSIVEDEIVKNGYNIRRSSSKTNMGLGRPLYEDRIKGGASE